MRTGSLPLAERVDRYDEQSEEREGADGAAGKDGDGDENEVAVVKGEGWMGGWGLYACWLRTTDVCEYGGRRGGG